MDQIEVKLVETEEEFEAAIGVRFRVFVAEQQVPAEEELDEFDATATHTVNASDKEPVAQVKELTDGRGADYTFEVFGSADTVKAAYDMAGKSGSVTIVGIAPFGSEAAINAVDIVRNEKTMRGTYYGSTHASVEMPKLVDMYLAGKLNLDDLVVRHYSLDQINEAYDDMDKGEVGRGVIVY